MGRITLVVDDHLEQKFREGVGKIKGYFRGSLKEAIEEAIHLWLHNNNIEHLEEEERKIIDASRG